MVDKEGQLEQLAQKWEFVLSPYREALSEKLTETELSALYSWLPVCFKAMHELYNELIPALSETPPSDRERLLDLFYALGGTAGVLEHIKTHIDDAGKGFNALLEILDDTTGTGKQS